MSKIKRKFFVFVFLLGITDMQMRVRNMQKKCKEANNTIILRKWVDRPVQILFQHRTAWDEQFVPVFCIFNVFGEPKMTLTIAHVSFNHGGFCNIKF
jgi:hypothetical protein